MHWEKEETIGSGTDIIPHHSGGYILIGIVLKMNRIPFNFNIKSIWFIGLGIKVKIDAYSMGIFRWEQWIGYEIPSNFGKKTYGNILI